MEATPPVEIGYLRHDGARPDPDNREHRPLMTGPPTPARGGRASALKTPIVTVSSGSRVPNARRGRVELRDEGKRECRALAAASSNPSGRR
jgi:hypothetical protein